MSPEKIINAIEDFAPRWLQESWDNTGLQIGFPQGADCTGVLVCVDVTEEIIAEAIERGCNLVVSHHPLIFKGMKSLTGRSISERAALAAIRAGVAVYSSHTALDSTRGGVSYALAAMLGAKVLRALEPAEIRQYSLQVICPRDMSATVRAFLAGEETAAAPEVEPVMGLYEHRPLTSEQAVVDASRLRIVTAALDRLGGSVSYTAAPLESNNTALGLGVVADYAEPVTPEVFLAKVKEVCGTPTVRCNLAFRSMLANDSVLIRRIALCGGAGGEFISKARTAGADVYVTADVRYHDFADNRSGMGILDVGHFESEKCAKDIFYHVLTKKFPNFAVYYSKIEKNPVQYL